MSMSYQNPLNYQMQNSFLLREEEDDTDSLVSQTEQVFQPQINQVLPHTLSKPQQTQQDILSTVKKEEDVSAARSILQREGITSARDILQREGITSAKDILKEAPTINIQELINRPPPVADTKENAALVEQQLKAQPLPEEVRAAFESSNLTKEQFKTLSSYFNNQQLLNEADADIANAPTVREFVDRNRSGYEFSMFAATRVPKYGGAEDPKERFGKLGALTAQYIGTVAEGIQSAPDYETPSITNYYFTKPDGTIQALTPTSEDTFVAEVGNFYGEDKVWYTAGIEYYLDPETKEFKINKPTVNAYVKQKKNLFKTIAPIAMMIAMPYAGAVGSSLFGLSGAAATAAGAATISAGIQLAATGKIDPLQVAISAGSGYVGYNAGLTGADIAAEAAQLIDQGLSASQAATTIAATGVNSVTATVAANLAAAGVPASVAPTITAATLNMGFSGIVAAATGGDVPDALIKGALTGASTGISTAFMDSVVGAENINAIANATKLTPDQVRGVGALAVSEGISAEISGSNNFLSAAKTSLVANGLSYKAANQMMKALDSNVSPAARVAIFNATREATNVATRAAISGNDVEETLKTMAPYIAGRSVIAGAKTASRT